MTTPTVADVAAALPAGGDVVDIGGGAYTVAAPDRYAAASALLAAGYTVAFTAPTPGCIVVSRPEVEATGWRAPIERVVRQKQYVALPVTELRPGMRLLPTLTASMDGGTSRTITAVRPAGKFVHVTFDDGTRVRMYSRSTRRVYTTNPQEHE